MAHHCSTSSYSLGSVGVAGVVSAPSDGLLELVVSDDDVVSLSGVASGAISFSASAIYDQQEKKRYRTKSSTNFFSGMNFPPIHSNLIWQ